MGRKERQGYDKDLPEEQKEERDNEGVHSFWRRWSTYIFDVQVT